jgi:lysophospholipase L1-like esterase
MTATAHPSSIPARDEDLSSRPRHRRAASRAIVVLVAWMTVVALGTRASSPTGSFDAIPASPSFPVVRTVSVVGDSITVVARPDISTALAGSYDTDVHGKWGQRIDQMLPTLAAVLRQHPSAVVVNLGSNDAIQAETHRGWQTSFAHMVNLLAPTRCVLLTTISTLLDDRNPPPPVAAEIDAAIERVASTRPNFHIVDWNAAVHADNGRTLLSPDRIHPSPMGQLTLAALIRTAVDRDCRHFRT